jgi:hypothetical protein
MLNYSIHNSYSYSAPCLPIQGHSHTDEKKRTGFPSSSVDAVQRSVVVVAASRMMALPGYRAEK